MKELYIHNYTEKYPSRKDSFTENTMTQRYFRLFYRTNTYSPDMNYTSSIITYILIIITFESCTNGHKCGKNEEGDSIYTVTHIQDMTITQPHEVLALLDTAEQKRLMKSFDIKRLRCLAYHNGLSNYKRALMYALEAYNSPGSHDNSEEFLNLIEMIVDEYYQNGNYAKSVDYCYKGLKLAQETGNRKAEANLNITLGLNLLRMRCQNKAFSHFNVAIGILGEKARKSFSYGEWDDYVYAIGITINSFCDEKQYDEAIAMLPTYEEAMNKLKDCTDIPDGLADMRLASGYAAYAYIYRLKGKNAEADKFYALLCKTRIVSTPDGEQMRIPYLLVSRHYRDALYYIAREKRYWRENTDTVSYDYIDTHLKYEQQAYEDMEDFRSAHRVQSTIVTLMDTLRQRERQEDALEFAEIYKTNEQAHRIEIQESSIRMRNVIIVSAVLFLLAAIAFIAHVLRYSHTIRKKNGAMVKTINELMAYKNELFTRQKENIYLREELQKNSGTHQDEKMVDEEENLEEEDDDADLAEESCEENGQLISIPKLTERDHLLFDRMNHEIIRRHLYLRSDLTKKDLLKEFHIPKNKFSMLFKELANCSFTQYMQGLRLDHAVHLMREQPLWSLDSIAKESQMSRSAFYDQFQKKYGMKPSEFRKKDTRTSFNS